MKFHLQFFAPLRLCFFAFCLCSEEQNLKVEKDKEQKQEFFISSMFKLKENL